MKFTITEFDEMNELVALVKELKIMLINTTSKKWLTVNELSEYIGYSTNTIYKMINVEFFFNVHYHKPNAKILFDKDSIDDWVRGSGAVPCNVISNEMIDKLLTA